jgi:hypothetical protein
MPYVSCMLSPPNDLDPEVKEVGKRNIQCIDENGTIWHLTEDSQVGDWLRYVEADGTVQDYSEDGLSLPESEEET